jgi:hypothetical protein
MFSGNAAIPLTGIYESGSLAKNKNQIYMYIKS